MKGIVSEVKGHRIHCCNHMQAREKIRSKLFFRFLCNSEIKGKAIYPMNLFDCSNVQNAQKVLIDLPVHFFRESFVPNRFQLFPLFVSFYPIPKYLTQYQYQMETAQSGAKPHSLSLVHMHLGEKINSQQLTQFLPCKLYQFCSMQQRVHQGYFNSSFAQLTIVRVVDVMLLIIFLFFHSTNLGIQYYYQTMKNTTYCRGCVIA